MIHTTFGFGLGPLAAEAALMYGEECEYPEGPGVQHAYGHGTGQGAGLRLGAPVVCALYVRELVRIQDRVRAPRPGKVGIRMTRVSVLGSWVKPYGTR